MKENSLRGNTCPATPNRRALKNMTRRFSRLKLLACALLLYNTASAQIVIDGNPGDWPNVLVGTGGASITAFTVDPVNDKSDNKFTMGSQQVDPISGWHWKHGNVNDKEDLSNTGLAVIGRTLYFFSDLHSSNGDAAIGFWLLKGGVDTNTNGTFSGAHVDGDILVSVLFTKGHVTATPTIYKWIGGSLVQPTGPQPAGAATNSVAVTSPFNYTPKKNDGDPGIYPVNTFFEGFINLDDVIGPDDPCFASALFMTWESQQPHAALSDLVMLTPIRVKCGCSCMMEAKQANSVNTLIAGEFNLYPNPSNGTFGLNVGALSSDAVAVVVDLYGRVVDRRTIAKSDNGQQLSYNLKLSPGIYNIRVDNNDIHYSDKIVVK